nr:endoplasmic reticulum resident protein 44-like [Maniola hyperantus]
MENSDSSCDPNGSSIVEITDNNFDMVLASSEVVFLFYKHKEYQYSNRTHPMHSTLFENAAKEISKAGLGPGKVVMAKLDCKKYEAVRTRFVMTHISSPRFRLFRNGYPTKLDYRGQYTVEAIVEFIKEQLTDPVIPFSDLNELHDLCEDKGHVIAYLDSKDQPEYDVLRKVATTLRERCRFYVKFGDSAQEMHRPGQPIVVLRTDKKTSVEPDETFHGSLLNFEELYTWVQQKCIPLVREITFENAEELTEEGLPFLVLFHKPTDTESVKKYKEIVRRELESEKQNINFLKADGIRFTHPMDHLGKSVSDLPLIAIDSFQYMYLFPDYKDMEKPGKLKEFLQDFYSGKLQRSESSLVVA